MKFGDNLRNLRELKGYSQIQLSKDLGISNVTLSQYENEVRKPDIDTLKFIANYFNVTSDYLLGRTNDPELTERDERDIARKLDSILLDMNSQDALMFDGEEIEMDEESKELLRMSLENSLRLAKKLAKEKYTPKKYKK